MTEYLTNDSQVCIWGTTGKSEKYGGKTALANWWLYNTVNNGSFDYGIFWNDKLDSFIKGHKATNLQQVAQHIANGNRLIDFQPSGTIAQKQHKKLMQYLTKLNGSKIVAHDEAGDYDIDGGSLHRAVKKLGNQANMKSLVLCQDPVDLSKRIRKQCSIRVWISHIGNTYKTFFKSELGAEQVYNHIKNNHKRFYWTVFDKSGEIVDYNEPIPKKYA